MTAKKIAPLSAKDELEKLEELIAIEIKLKELQIKRPIDPFDRCRVEGAVYALKGLKSYIEGCAAIRPPREVAA